MKASLIAFMFIVALALPVNGIEGYFSRTTTPSVHSAGGEAVLSTVSVAIPASADTWIEASLPDANYGDGNATNVRYVKDFGQLRYSTTLLQFDVASYLPAGAIIESATLTLHVFICQVLPPVNVGAYYLNDPWSEDSVAWKSRPSSGTVGLNSQLDCPWGGPAPEHATWYVTSFAAWWLSHPAENNGLELRGPFTGDYYYWGFYTSEWSLEKSPTLVVNYRLPPRAYLPIVVKW